MSKANPVLIAGGGIGGLSAALALARQGIAVRVLERTAAPSAAGAGIQLGPNAVSILRKLGVEPLIPSMAVAPRSIRVFDGSAGRLLTELPLGAWIEARHGAPYLTFHRADLLAALLARADEEPLIEAVSSFEVTAIKQESGSVRVQSVSGQTAGGAGLIGADGLWSRVRREVVPGDLKPTPFSAARSMIDAHKAAAPFASESVGLWLAPSAHVVHYPVRAGRATAVVVVFEDDRATRDWDGAGQPEEISRAVAACAPELRGFIALAEPWRKWSLYDPKPLPRWTNNRVTLLGDAAHPILPYLAQGGALAIEDAVTLAACVARDGDDIAVAFARYARARRPRAARVQAASRRNGWIYHLEGPMGSARNAVLRAMPSKRLMAGYDWLYGWRAGTAHDLIRGHEDARQTSALKP